MLFMDHRRPHGVLSCHSLLKKECISNAPQGLLVWGVTRLGCLSSAKNQVIIINIIPKQHGPLKVRVRCTNDLWVPPTILF